MILELFPYLHHIQPLRNFYLKLFYHMKIDNNDNLPMHYLIFLFQMHYKLIFNLHIFLLLVLGNHFLIFCIHHVTRMNGQMYMLFLFHFHLLFLFSCYQALLLLNYCHFVFHEYWRDKHELLL